MGAHRVMVSLALLSSVFYFAKLLVKLSINKKQVNQQGYLTIASVMSVFFFNYLINKNFI